MTDSPSSVPVRFASIAARFGTRTTVRFDDEVWAYAELDAHSSRIAACLLAHVEAGACVGLAMGKEPRLIAAILGALKAGCAYVPLDPSYPAERLRHFA